MRLQPSFVTDTLGSEAYCVRFSPDASLLALASGSGAVCIHNVSTGMEAFRLQRTVHHPSKQACWRPQALSCPVRSRNLLVVASTDGRLRQWHVPTAHLMKEFGPKDATQLFCVDYSADGSRIVAGGMRELWVFDDESKKEICNLKGGDSSTTGGHVSRIFATRFQPSEPSTVFSGGWDNTVQVWDTRVGHAVRAIPGPHICGDALDVSADGRFLLTGSWRDEDPLEVWDVGSGLRHEVIPWRPPGITAAPPCMLYTAKFTDDSARLVIAGGSTVSGGGEAKIFERGAASERACLGTLTGVVCLSAHAAALGGWVAFGGSDGHVRVLRFQT
eukprot:NODE_14408_length_1110_cov_12.686673.p1 GENE.NODE_14408_length_1110_cov_12.686673~~NODE_14408_length_1110_cov_12.686673.p1  ORF type:complete len:331 (-),score=66.42 NODE_14408_length_1110_cov_12.686673:79-1071(-)